MDEYIRDPLPWQQEHRKGLIVQDANGYYIASCSRDHQARNIIVAVNERPAMLAEIQRIRVALQNIVDDIPADCHRLTARIALEE